MSKGIIDGGDNPSRIVGQGAADRFRQCADGPTCRADLGQEQPTRTIEKTCGSKSYADFCGEHSHRNLAALTASVCINHHHNNENKGITYA
jgi:hypothetical protein